jgi:hypothetical protein
MDRQINAWKVVESKSDKHPEFGYPMGQVLCRSNEEAEEYIKKSEFTDCLIRDYSGNDGLD